MSDIESIVNDFMSFYVANAHDGCPDGRITCPLPDLLQDIRELAVEYFTELAEMAPKPEILRVRIDGETFSVLPPEVKS